MVAYLAGIVNILCRSKISQSVRPSISHMCLTSESTPHRQALFGGGVFYSNVRDYLAIFRHLLLAKGAYVEKILLFTEVLIAGSWEFSSWTGA